MSKGELVQPLKTAAALAAMGLCALFAIPASGAPMQGIASATGLPPLAANEQSLEKGGVVQVRRWRGRRVIIRPGVVLVRPRWRYRAWRHRPHYGTFVAGLALGTIIAVAVANAAPPPPPDSGLCWYWSNRAHTHGYWDYCDEPR